MVRHIYTSVVSHQMGPGATALTRMPQLGMIICARPFVNCRMAPYRARQTRKLKQSETAQAYTVAAGRAL